MNPLFIASIILLVVVSILHLYFCFAENEKWRHITKVFILPLLAAALLAAGSRQLAIYGAIVFGWIGDIFLIFKKKGRRYLFMGLISFFIGHCFFILEIVRRLSYRVPPIFLLAIAGFGLLFIFGAYFIVSKKLGKMALPVAIYAFALIILMSASVMLAIDIGRIINVFIIVGAVLFAISDTTIAYSYFYHDFKRRDFYIMVPYILAQSGLVLGLAFISLH